MRFTRAKSGVGEVYSTVGWVLIILGVVAGLAAGTTGPRAPILPFIIGVVSGAVLGLPFLAIGAILERLAQLVDLQTEANEDTADMVNGLQANNKLLKQLLSTLATSAQRPEGLSDDALE